MKGHASHRLDGLRAKGAELSERSSTVALRTTWLPPGTFAEPVRPSVMSRAGLSYRSASGGPIKNLGQTTVHFGNGGHRRCVMPFQLAEVERPLISVARLVDAGSKV